MWGGKGTTEVVTTKGEKRKGPDPGRPAPLCGKWGIMAVCSDRESSNGRDL